MAVLTESLLRSRFLNKQLNEPVLELPMGTILTPSAKSYLQEKRIDFTFVEKNKAEENKAAEATVYEQPKKSDSPMKYRVIQGGYLDEKPEHMTALHSNLLVYKDHPRIIFRGKLDSLEAKMIEAQWNIAENNYSSLADDLSEVLGFVREILRAEVLEEDLGEFRLLHMDEKEIREMSHHPEKYFGIGDFTPDFQMGAGIVALNAVRTAVRETELAAYQAFKKEDGTTARDDIILALNRLSSLCYCLMVKFRAGHYKAEKRR
ncbi:cobalamin adenosyltransferase [Virgibacillus sp. YIM 98842]|jgi:ethanolamine utilization cobalamin adenosyltransferase|uniref:cobalamin adenosyltransferase n=1 Tax=Virgibacillus sp. YIM 98842 TaxID=2663533 RepID=UPI0013DA54A3|nr:cobalamin adenosyltransferase [Virgibacillus sp. YIM 98842]